MRPSRMFGTDRPYRPGMANLAVARAPLSKSQPPTPPPSPSTTDMISMDSRTDQANVDGDVSWFEVNDEPSIPVKSIATGKKTERKTQRLLVPKMTGEEDSAELSIAAGRNNRLLNPNLTSSLLDGFKPTDKAFDDFSVFGADSPNTSDHESDGSLEPADSQNGMLTSKLTKAKESNGQGRLLLVSLLENFCDLYDQDPDKNRRLFLALCRRLSSMGVSFS
jgi:hypothetical protein